MPGNHEFKYEGGVRYCKYCGEFKADLDQKRVEGRLPPCPDAPVENASQAGKDYLSPLFFLN